LGHFSGEGWRRVLPPAAPTPTVRSWRLTIRPNHSNEDASQRLRDAVAAAVAVAREEHDEAQQQ